jgi:hypothetical protein
MRDRFGAKIGKIEIPYGNGEPFVLYSAAANKAFNRQVLQAAA